MIKFNKNGRITSVWKEVVIGEEADKLNYIYQAAFDAVSTMTPCLQSYHPDELLGVLGDGDIVKLIIYLGSEPAGFTLATANLDKVPWINKKFFAHRFPEEYKKGRVFYIKSAQVAPELQNILTGDKQKKILVEILRLCEIFLPEDSIFCYDCSSILTGWYTRFLLETSRAVHSLDESWERGLDSQTYYAFRKNYEEGYGKKLKKKKRKDGIL